MLDLKKPTDFELTCMYWGITDLNHGLFSKDEREEITGMRDSIRGELRSRGILQNVRDRMRM